MFWMIAVGIGCIAMALYIFVVGDRLSRAETNRDSFSRRKITQFLKHAVAALLLAIAFIARLLGKVLYFVYFVLRYLVVVLAKVGRSLARTLMEWQPSRSRHVSRQGQDKSGKRNEPFLTDKEMRRISEEIQRQGVVKYIEKR